MSIPFSITGTIDANGESVALDYRTETPNIRRFNGAVGIQITGTFSGTLNLELTRDGSTYVGVLALNETTNVAEVNVTGTGLYRAELTGVRALRVRSTAWTSGAAVVTLIAVEG